MTVEHVYLHAGLHKTGSSSIQATLFANRHRLDELGISYWDIASNHSLPLRIAFSRDKRLSDQRRVLWSPKQVQSDLSEALKRSQPKFIVSGEGMSRLTAPDLARLKSVLEVAGPATITVIVYVRDPRSLYNSIVQEWLKKGGALESVSGLPKYRERIEKFLGVFGPAHVRLRRFAASSFVGGDLMSDFFAAIDEPPALATSFPAAHKNVSLSQQAVQLLDAVKRSAERDEWRQPLAWLAGEFLTPYVPGKPFRVSSDKLESMLAGVQDEIAWLSSQGIVFAAPQDQAEDEEASVDLDLNAVGELVYRLAKELATLRAAEKYRLGKAELDRNRRAQARKLFQQSLKYVPNYPLAVTALETLHREED